MLISYLPTTTDDIVLFSKLIIYFITEIQKQMIMRNTGNKQNFRTSLYIMCQQPV